MSVEAIMEAPADPEAGAREQDVERELTEALARATSPEERGRLHDELARHYERRTLYRKMNRQETASVQAYAEASGGEPIAEALALYQRAMKAFGARENENGRALLRSARALAVAHLPLRHSWALRVTHTMAGRLTLTDAAEPTPIDEIVPLYELLERETVANCGPDHLASIGSTKSLAYAYKTAGRNAEALTRFERAFDYYLQSPRRLHEAQVLLDAIGATFRAMGDPEGVARFEEALLAHDGASYDVVRRSRFDRDPALRAEIDRRAVEHAAPQFVGRAAAAVFESARATLDDSAPSYFTAANEVYGAMLALERELGIVPEEDDEEEGVTYEHPLCAAEMTFQDDLYEELWAKREAARIA